MRYPGGQRRGRKDALDTACFRRGKLQVSKHLLPGETPIKIRVQEEDRRVLLRHIDDEETVLQGAFILLSYDLE